MPSVALSTRSVLVLVLSATLADTSLDAQPVPANATLPPSHRNRSAPLTAQERTLHALNRFTFGPRPGEVAAVSRTGLDRWFEQQLNPQSIDDSAFDTRLVCLPRHASFAATAGLPLPSNQLIRIAARGELPLPSDPNTHAIYADQHRLLQRGPGPQSRRDDRR